MEEIKRRSEAYWNERAEGFLNLRHKEFHSDMSERWMHEFQQYLPRETGLKILDIGTGTGYFSLLLTRAGHSCIGIDLSEEMILRARETAWAHNISAEFHVMDAEQPDFPQESFDVIVTRNLTWTLPHLPESYQRWYGLLKTGGILINFDADYCRENTDTPLPENHAHKEISDHLHQEYETMKDLLRSTQQPRPQWDVALLTQAGFRDVAVDTGVWKRIYRDFDEFYNPTPIFTITARK